jgi:hypothetical protein
MAGSGAGSPYRARLWKASGTSGAGDVIKDAVTPEASGTAGRLREFFRKD